MGRKRCEESWKRESFTTAPRLESGRSASSRWCVVCASVLSVNSVQRDSLAVDVAAATADVSVIMATLCNRTGHYIFALWFLSYSLFFPRLVSAVGDWMSTILPHMVWP